jgi:hypothetical protein
MVLASPCEPHSTTKYSLAILPYLRCLLDLDGTVGHKARDAFPDQLIVMRWLCENAQKLASDVRAHAEHVEDDWTRSWARSSTEANRHHKIYLVS